MLIGGAPRGDGLECIPPSKEASSITGAVDSLLAVACHNSGLD